MQLEEDLKKMKCEGLLAQPWAFKDKDMVRELATTPSNTYNKTIWSQPKEWTLGVWKQIYSFPNGGAGMASKSNKYVDNKFTHVVDPKDGFVIKDCRDARKQRLVEFLVPINHLEKPTRVTIILGNTIFWGLEDPLIDWGVVLRDLVQRLAVGVGKTKIIPIYFYLFYLYQSRDCLMEQEEIDYEATKELISYRITPNLEPPLSPVSGEEGQQTKNPKKQSEELKKVE